jgi:hypothetical protein
MRGSLNAWWPALCHLWAGRDGCAQAEKIQMTELTTYQEAKLLQAMRFR